MANQIAITHFMTNQNSWAYGSSYDPKVQRAKARERFGTALTFADGSPVLYDTWGGGWCQSILIDGQEVERHVGEIYLLFLDPHITAKEKKIWHSFYKELHAGHEGGPHVINRVAKSASSIERVNHPNKPWTPDFVYAVHEPDMKLRRKALVPLALWTWNCVFPVEDVRWQVNALRPRAVL